MALILSLRRDEDFYVDDAQVFVNEIHSDQHFVLETPDGTHWEIVQDRMSEILPNVFVSSGISKNSEVARVVLDAPREILILRGGAKRRGS